MAISGWRRGFWFGPLLPPRGQENRNNHKVKKEERAFFTCGAFDRSHSTGLVQDCLDILAPDEILKVEL